MKTENEDSTTGNKKDKLKKENEEIKKQLEEDFGALKQWSNPDLPPEMENEFLKNIMEFEKAHKEMKYVTLFEFLGNPFYRPLKGMSEVEIEMELNRLLELMGENDVILDTICDVPDEELYRFITEELFKEEVEDSHVPNMSTYFIYEEFYPNHEYDLKTLTEDFLQKYLDKNSDDYDKLLTYEALKLDWHKNFRATFSRFEIEKYKLLKLDFDLDEEKGTASFQCDVKATVDGSGDVFHIRGKGKMNFVLVWDFWSVDTLKLPKPVKE